MLSTHQLHVFLTAAETLNFTQAAKRLQISQPNVSQHIQALENYFEMPLFERLGRNLELTEAGLALVPLAREMVFLSQRIEETLANIRGGVHGHLVVGCSTTYGRYALPSLLTDFHKQFPTVRATCLVVDPHQALEMLTDGRVHLALANEPDCHQNLEFRRFASETIHLVTPLDHPWATRDWIAPEELFAADLILPQEGSEIYQVLERTLKNLGFSIYRLNPLITLGSPEAIALSIQEGLGAGFVPETILNRLVSGKVHLATIRDMPMQFDVYIGRNVHRPATAAQSEFWRFIHSKEL